MPEKNLKGTEKYIPAYAIKDSVNEDQRRIRFVVSSDEIDRHGDRVEAKAIKKAIPAFAKNPVALACHRHHLENGEPPVVGSWDTKSFEVKDGKSMMDMVFAVTENADKYWSLYKDGHMKAVSIGFRILDYHVVEEDGRKIYVITKIELYEISCVAVGANRQALAKKGFEFGEPVDGDIKSICEKVSMEVHKEVKVYFDDQFKSLRETFENDLDEIKDLLIGDNGDPAGAELGVTSDPESSTAKTDPEQLERVMNTLKKALENFENQEK